MAYILGFFAADGSISVNKRGGQFWSIQITDKELLEDMRTAVGSEHAISVRPERKNTYKALYRLQIGSIEMCDDLRRLGYSERKTESLAVPNVPKKYLSDFVRGYFDGDGSITITKSNNIAITILGTKQFLKEIKKLYNEYCNTDCGWIAQHNKSRIYHFCIHGNVGGIKFLKWIYKNESIKFDRKYKIYTNFMSSF